MTEKQRKIYNTLVDLGSTEVVDIILNFHGTQLLSDDFFEHLIDEGVIEDNLPGVESAE
jgi:hypothetical protein